MANINASGSAQDQLNRCMPAAADVKLGNLLAELIARNNALTSAFNAVLAKLDDDAGVTDTNYEATHAVSAAAIKGLEERY